MGTRTTGPAAGTPQTSLQIPVNRRRALSSFTAMPGPRIELLWWEGCPSHPRALAELREVLDGLGLDPDAVDVRHIGTDDEAAAEGFPGSPTIRVDGRDVQPADGEPVGLTCRVYRLRDGRISPTPDPADVRDAIAGAARSAA
jgi:hypothetical protein